MRFKTKRVIKILSKVFVRLFGIDENLTQKFASRELLTKWENIKYILTREAMIEEYYTSNLVKRRKIASMFFGANASVQWAKNYNAKLNFFDYSEHVKEKISMSWLKNKLSTGNFNVHEIGTSSGRHIAHFAKLFPKSRFLGSKPFHEVISYLNEEEILNFQTTNVGIWYWTNIHAKKIDTIT